MTEWEAGSRPLGADSGLLRLTMNRACPPLSFRARTSLSPCPEAGLPPIVPPMVKGRREESVARDQRGVRFKRWRTLPRLLRIGPLITRPL